MLSWIHNLFRFWMFAVPFWCLWWTHESRVLYRDDLTIGDWLLFSVGLIGPPVVAFGLGRLLYRAVENIIASRTNQGPG
jgi:hypothetical protein